jgi:hypothetical protein
MKSTKQFLSIGLFALACSPAAHAVLGGDASTLQADRMQMKATAPVASSKLSYTVHEMTTGNGVTVREYVADGKVFGVAWRGPRVPNLKQLMGPYFDTYVTEAGAKHSGHTHLAFRRPELVVRASGHMRAFSGTAYVPGMLPAGVAENDIQ